MTTEELMAQDFGTLSALIAAQGRDRPGHPALVDGERTLDYAGLNTLMDRIAAALQRDGVGPNEAAAICATTSLEYAAVFMGALRAGSAAAPLAPSSTADSLVMMLNDCGAKVFFLDEGVAALLEPVADQI
ncbi:MAG: class I adenylate-forming enzyme family protein, partial [Phenylobacterium sp.]|nr:class I adenylate-forming enzyme family protein [Phenylobacterium sp.]